MTDPHHQKSFLLDPVKSADFAMTLINKVGLPLLLLGFVGWYLAPAHLKFLETASEEQKRQTTIINEMRETASKSFAAQADNDKAMRELVEAIGSGDSRKLESLEVIEGKVDRNGHTLEEIHEKVNGIHSAVGGQKK